MKKLLFISCILINHLIFANTEKYRLIYRTDPSTSIVVSWCQNGGSNPIVYYDVVDHGANFSAYTFQKSVDRTESYKSMTHNFSRLTGLQPNTNYYFVIKDSDGTSSRFWFKTLPINNNTPLSVIAGGDSRTNPSARQNANRLVSKLRPHFVMFGGDMTDTNLDHEWQDWFDDWQLTISADGRMYPIIPARGNHEWSNADIYNMFDVIDQDAIYALNVGGDMARIYTLNSESAIAGNQSSWLQNDLQTNYQNTEWILAQYHKPMRPHVGSKSEGNDQYAYWSQLFYDYKMNVVVECDAHTVKSTWPVKPSVATGNDEGFIKDTLNGTVYIGEGCWGAPLRNNDDNKSWTRNSGKFNSFNWIHLHKEKIEIRTIGTDNEGAVGVVNDSNPFVLPSNIDVWNPSNGDVIVIENPKYQGRPLVNITYPQSNHYFTQSQSITIQANAIDTNGTIQKVEFFINGNLISTDLSAPWDVNYTIPSNGITTIKAVAYDNDGFFELDEIYVYSGSISITSQIIASNDDAEEDKSDGDLDITSSDLELSVEDNTWPLSDVNQWVGMRFRDLNIPIGATIDTAYIQFTVDETESSAAISNIYGEKNFDATPFYDLPYNISARTKTTAFTSWNIPAWNNTGDAGLIQRSPDLSLIVQEIINTTNWSANNAMVFLVDGAGTRTSEAYDGDANSAPVLHVVYHMVSTEVAEAANKLDDVKIYPNPTSNNLTVDLTSLTENTRLNIYSLNGKIVLSEELIGGELNVIHLKNRKIAKGVYILSLNTNDLKISKKLIVK